jgi:hypothetical protein
VPKLPQSAPFRQAIRRESPIGNFDEQLQWHQFPNVAVPVYKRHGLLESIPQEPLSCAITTTASIAVSSDSNGFVILFSYRPGSWQSPRRKTQKDMLRHTLPVSPSPLASVVVSSVRGKWQVAPDAR